MNDLIELLVPWATAAAALFAILWGDERRMSDEQRARAWPATTRRIAVIVFGAVALPIHFARTRRRLAGFAIGMAWMAATVALETATSIALDAMLAGVPADAHEGR